VAIKHHIKDGEIGCGGLKKRAPNSDHKSLYSAAMIVAYSQALDPSSNNGSDGGWGPCSMQY